MFWKERYTSFSIPVIFSQKKKIPISHFFPTPFALLIMYTFHKCHTHLQYLHKLVKKYISTHSSEMTLCIFILIKCNQIQFTVLLFDQCHSYQKLRKFTFQTKLVCSGNCTITSWALDYNYDLNLSYSSY